MNLMSLTAVELGKKIKSGEVTAVEATKAALEQIKKLDGTYNCYAVSYTHLSDGAKVLMSIAKLYRNYKPMHFFGIMALLLTIISAGFFCPVLAEYVATGLVPKFPTLIVCGFTLMAAIQSVFAGLILSLIHIFVCVEKPKPERKRNGL